MHSFPKNLLLIYLENITKRVLHLQKKQKNKL